MYNNLIEFLNSLEQQQGFFKLNKVLAGHPDWIKMTGAEHQKFGKYLKRHRYLLTNNIHFYRTSNNNDGIYN